MWKIVGAICAVVLVSCSRQNADLPQPQAGPQLKRMVRTNASDAVIQVTHYNEFELATFDTIFQTGTPIVGMTYISQYNAKGKRTRMENTIPILYTGGYYWAYQDYYQDDTLPTVTYRYLKGKQVAEITHFYNASKQLVLDSTYHTPNYGTYTYLNKFEYDAQGRLTREVELNDTRDTVYHIIYQYAPNRVEKWQKSFYYNPVFVSYGLIVSEYSSSGKILSEKGYDGQGGTQVLSQTDYTYDAAGNLLKKARILPAASATEERYFNNSTTGKPDKMEFYQNGQLIYIYHYYYE